MGSDTQNASAGGTGLDPEIREFVRAVSADAAPAAEAESTSIARARALYEKARVRWAVGGPAMTGTTDLEVEGRDSAVRVRLHRPDVEAPAPVLVYMHGGGWTYFSIDTHDRLMREYAARAGVVVAGVDYDLSPEHKYPVALNQVLDVVRWLGDEAGRLGIDPSRLALGGDSAGANLAVAATLALRDSGRQDAVRALLLNYGAFQSQCSARSVELYGGPDYMLGGPEMDAFWANYVRDPSDLADPLVCPIRADVSGLPPTFLAIPECDILAGQNLAMAERLRAAGVPVEAVLYPGATHSFLEAVSISRLSDRALDEAAEWLRGALSGMA